jgi:hypothetical protein
LERQANDAAAAVDDGHAPMPLLGRAAGIQRQSEEGSETLTIPVELQFKPSAPMSSRLPAKPNLEPGDTPEERDPARLAPWLFGTPKDHMPGVPVPGYESPRLRYVDADRDEFIKAVGQRRVTNEEAAENFRNQWQAALLELWTTHATTEMAAAAAHASLNFWGKLAKFIIQKSAEALILGAAGLIWEEELSWFAKKAISFTLTLAGDKTKGMATGEDVDEKVSATKATLDAKTLQLAAMVRSMPASEVIRVPWEWYVAWAKTAALPDLARFRIPPILPDIPEADIRASVAAAIVCALFQPHTHETSQHGLKDPNRGELEYVDPTLDEPISFFDDNIAIVHLAIGAGHEVAAEDAEIYTPSRVLLAALVGRQIKQMPGVPLFITVDPKSDDAWYVARELISAVRAVSPNLLTPDEGDEYAAFAKAYAGWAEKEQMHIVRFDGGERVTVSGGGLAEDLWLHRWAHGDDLRALVGALLRATEVASIEGLAVPAVGGTSSPARVSAAQLAEIAGKARIFDVQAGAETLITQYVAVLTVSSPENRWSWEYWRGNRDRLFHRDPSRIVRFQP